MLRFEDPIFLLLLWVIPILVLIRLLGWRRRRNKLRKLGDAELLKQLMPDISRYRPTVKFCLMLAALALLIVMLARPQMGSKVSHDKRQGIETIICLDISNSMLAEDVAPSRLDKSKMLIENLVDNFTNDKIGLVVFAGEAFVQLPITGDYVSAKMFLQNTNPSLIQSQGTNIAQAIDVARQSFTQQKNVGRAIIIITDGENHEPGAEEAAEQARKSGINVYILGIGTAKGAPIPMGDGSYLKDNTGNTVMTALNEDMCRELAKAGSGRYIHVDNTSDAEEQLNADLAKLQRGETDAVIYSEYDEQFQAVGIVVILLLILEICMLEIKNPHLRNIRFFGKTPFAMKRTATGKKALMAALLTASALSAAAQNDRSFIREGNRLFNARTWAQAETQYRKALSKNARNPQAVYNLGCALLMQQKDSMAMQQFTNAAQMETNNKLRRAKSFHNMGVVMQNHREYAKAIECYKMALRNNPQDNETRYNLALCKKLLKDQPNQNPNNKNDKNKDKDKDKDKNKDKNQNKNKDKNNDKDKQNQDKNQDKQNQDKMSRENAEQLLNAAVQQEKATKQKLQKAMSQPGRKAYDKNW